MGRSGKGWRACWDLRKGLVGREVGGWVEGLLASSVGEKGLSTIACNQFVIGEYCWVGE